MAGSKRRARASSCNGAGSTGAAVPTAPAARPMFAFALHAQNRNDEVKLSGAFAKLVDEDPALKLEHDAEMHQTLLWGQGEMHLKVAMDRLKNKFNVPVEAKAPRTPYRETIRKGPRRMAGTRSSRAATASSAT